MSENNYERILRTKIFVDNKWNCRGVIDDAAVADLADNIKQHGLLQPVVVCPHNEGDYEYRLIAGFRRFAACTKINLEYIDANVQADMDADDMRTINVLENLQRENLPFYQEAEICREFLDKGYTEAAIMDKLNMKRGWVQVRCMACKLPEDVYKRFIVTGIWDSVTIRDAYSHLNNKGLDGLKRFVAVYVKATQKAGGNKKVAKKMFKKGMQNTNIELTRKVARKKTEMKDMTELLLVTIGECLSTKCLAWASGDLSTLGLHRAIKKKADSMGIEYNVPEVNDFGDDQD